MYMKVTTNNVLHTFFVTRLNFLLCIAFFLLLAHSTPFANLVPRASLPPSRYQKGKKPWERGCSFCMALKNKADRNFKSIPSTAVNS